jgi:gamma-glutamylcyclotransferase (GGCT)/AIG2-like uncharacterized protein YtfP
MTVRPPTESVAFVYGTLTDPNRVADLVDAFEFRGRAVLDGFHTVTGRYPTLAPGGRARGRLLWVDDLDAVDEYEGVDRGLYTRVAVPRVDDGSVWTYVGNPEGLGLDEAVTWPGDGLFYDRVPAYVRDHDILVRPE